MPGADVETFAAAAKRLAEAFGQVTAGVVDPLGTAGGASPAARPEPGSLPAHPEPERLATQPESERLASLYRPGVMRRRLDQLIESHQRYGHRFCIAVFDVSGPAARNGS